MDLVSFAPSAHAGATVVMLLVRATLLLALAFAATVLLRKRAASLRRSIWAGTFLGLLLLPLVSLLLPSLQIAVVPRAAPPLSSPPVDLSAWYWNREAPFPRELAEQAPKRKAPADGVWQLPSPPAPATAASTPVPLGPLLSGVYVAGGIISLVRLLAARRRARALLRSTRPADAAWRAPRDVDVRESDALELPLTIGSWRPVVLVPASGRTWPPGWQRSVLAHELAHVRAADPFFQLLAELALALYWFHPLAHLALGRLRTERELAADDAALATGLPPSEYANLLVDLASVPEQPPVVTLGAVVPLLTPSGLKARLFGVLDGRRRRYAPRALRFGLAGSGLLLFVPLALALPVPRPPELPPLGLGAVVGRVIDDATGQPIAGAEVAFRTRMRIGSENLDATVVRSDDAGWFRYPWDAPVMTEFAIYSRAGERAARRSILNVPYGTKLPTDLSLRLAVTLSGRVHDGKGNPITGAKIRFAKDDVTAFSPGNGLEVRSDGEGRWRVPGMLYGKYLLQVTSPEGRSVFTHAVVADRDVQVETVVDGEPRVVGYIVDDHDQPLGGVRVPGAHARMRLVRDDILIAEPHPRVAEVRYLDFDVTEPDGSFRLEPRGNTHMPIRAVRGDGTVLFGYFDDQAALRYGTPPEPQRWRLAPGVLVRGVVRTALGAPAPAGLEVGFTGDLFAAQYTDATVRTDANGTFTLWVPRRTRKLYALPPGNPFVQKEARAGVTPVDLAVVQGPVSVEIHLP